MIEDKVILEPKTEFNKYYSKVSIEASKSFNKLKDKSKINIEINREYVEKYNILNDKCLKYESEINSKTVYCTLLIVLLIIMIVFAFILPTIGLKDSAVTTIYILEVVFSVLSIILLIKFKSELSNAKDLYNNTKKERDVEKDNAYKSIIGLTSLFDEMTVIDVLKKACPMITLDREFDTNKYLYMKEKYDFSDVTSDNDSVYDCLSGSLNGNPFLYQKIFKCRMKPKVYTGSLTIYWTEIEYDSEGNRHEVHKSEILFAEHTEDAPFYSYLTSLIYTNDAAPNLSFSRHSTNMDSKSDTEIESYVKRKTKKLERKENRDVGNNNSDFQLMANEEFECIFNAINRDNEREFRLLFTPLAQKNMLSLLKDKDPYGDDFSFYKEGPINTIISEHMQDNDLSLSKDNYITFSYDQLEYNFIEYTKSVFKGIYFDLAPLLSIPLYQINKPREMIYNKNYISDFNFTPYEAEAIANSFNPNLFESIESNTSPIIKIKGVKKEGNNDITLFRAYSYKKEPRVTYVPVYGKDGNMHSVPVDYYEYIPVTKDTYVTLVHSSYNKEELLNTDKNNGLSSLIKEFGSKNYMFKKGILALISNRNYNASVIDKISKYINKKEN